MHSCHPKMAAPTSSQDGCSHFVTIWPSPCYYKMASTRWLARNGSWRSIRLTGVWLGGQSGRQASEHLGTSSPGLERVQVGQKDTPHARILCTGFLHFRYFSFCPHITRMFLCVCEDGFTSLYLGNSSRMRNKSVFTWSFKCKSLASKALCEYWLFSGFNLDPK